MMEDPEFVKCTIKEGDLKILNKAARERGLRLRPKTGRSARASATAKSS
ncbi:MAG: hypothetical protein JW774_06625 [Candidatus Aureabacteria bacterium]|nr:hypothetical protein [Candidatus Auribacterota bacterium]